MRELHLSFEPAPAFRALGQLARAARESRWPLSARLHGALEAELATVERGLETFASSIEWLEAQRFAVVAREQGRERERAGARRAKEPRAEALARAVTVELDLRELSEGLVQERDDREGFWHVTAFALRTVLDRLRAGGLFALGDVRSGRRAATLAEASAALAAAVKRAKAQWAQEQEREREAQARAEQARAQKAQREKERARAEKEREKERARREQAQRERAEQAEREQRAREQKERERAARAEQARAEREREERERREREARRAQGKQEKQGKRAGARGRGAQSAGFGGLPDDAQPEDRVTGAPLGPRGISTDAEFFLEHAGIAAWPCAASELEPGRKRALARLHPDRIGEAGTALFQRASRGYAELVRRLAQLGAAATATTAKTATSAPATTASKPAATSASKPAAAPAPAVEATPPVARTRKKPVQATATPTPTPTPAATRSAGSHRVATAASIGQWPLPATG